MAETIITGEGQGQAQANITTGEGGEEITSSGSLIDVKPVVVEKPIDTTGEEKPKEGGEEEKPKEGEGDVTALDVKETLEKFGDLMEEGKMNEVLEDFNGGKISGKDLINKILNEVGIAKDEMEKQIDVEIESVKKSLEDKPIEGVDLKDLSTWVSSQGAEMVKIASDLTDFALGEDAVRSAIALLNKVRMGKVGVGDPTIKVVPTVIVDKDALRDEYMDIMQTKEGNERTVGVANLVKKAEKTGDVDLISWAKGMFD